MTPSKVLLRKDVPLESTWNREAGYASWDAWKSEYDTALAEIPLLGGFSGKIKEGSQGLVNWLSVFDRHWRRTLKLLLFARMAVSVDSGDLEAKGYYGQAVALYAKVKAAAAFSEREILEIGEELFTWVEDEPQLGKYKHYLENTLRLKPHQRSAEVEEILSMLEEPFDSVMRTAMELTNTDLKFNNAVDSRGNEHPVHQATITPSGIQSSDREHRRTAWENFCDSHLGMQNTLANNYITKVKQKVFLAKVRGYDSVLEMMLSPTNLPVTVFHNVMDTFREQLPVWHRYWDVKRKVLGVEHLHPYDVWAPGDENPPKISYPQAVDWVCEAMDPLGDAYVSVMRRGCLQERWVDYAPNVGKMQGAASSRRIDLPPYIFMSYDDTLMSVSVLAHELGHSMHTYFSNENQPVVYNDFDAISSSVAETASNFNQAMLRSYLQASKKDDRIFQIALIDECIFNFHRYFFTMPILARFEFEVFSRAQNGQPFTAQVLNQIMRDLYAEGYGDTMNDDPERSGITWAQFVHLYMPFYTFQYAVGIGAAHALAAQVLAGEEYAAENYMKFLSAGGSLYPLEVFDLAGVDMTKPEPIKKAFEVLSSMVDRLEDLTT